MQERQLRTLNRILNRLPSAEYQRLLPRLTRRVIEPNRVLQRATARIRFVYFIVDGVFSEVLMLRDGMADVGLIGAEGLLGLSVWYGIRRATTEWRSLTRGTVLQMPVDAFLAASQPKTRLHEVLRHYASGVFTAAEWIAACNGRHRTEQRVARWLLTASDRLGQTTLCVSHRTVAHMLGVRRAGVSELLGQLAQRRIIELGRSTLCILDRKRLERRACECYAAIRRAVPPSTGVMPTLTAPSRGHRGLLKSVTTAR
ncbi:MAG TPA: Crp/Fnr family transcriptional regulator [Nitrospirales bacterium]|nr:Crp/Fnr family transcriptional regulator [Nitrospirales bacterium]